ncbi:MAG: Threonine-phosphate decarboxylase [Firmicutes bacterium]|nr:Threonine-phosphate decarboxylase [Bacillota bacterium]
MSQPFIHGGNIHQAARSLAIDPQRVLDFSANINPLGLPQELSACLANSFWRLEHYPDPECLDARQALAEHHFCDMDEITVGNGAAEIFQLICLSLKPRRILAFEPTYSGYAFSAHLYGIPYVPLVQDPWFEPQVGHLGDVIEPRDMLFLCSPNNPTGRSLTRAQVDFLVELTAGKGAFLVLDESFYDFLPSTVALGSYIAAPQMPSHVVVVRSLTKILALPGLRLGYARAQADIAAKLRSVRDPWSVNALALEAAKVYPFLSKYIETTQTLIATENLYLRQNLPLRTPFTVVSGEANFLLINLRAAQITATLLCNRLFAQGILVRNCNTFAHLGEDYVRVAVRTHQENQRLIEALESAIL